MERGRYGKGKVWKGGGYSGLKGYKGCVVFHYKGRRKGVLEYIGR